MMRYGPRRGNRMMGVTDTRNGRLRGVLILVLLLTLIVLAIVGVPAMKYRSDADSYMSARMLTECGAAMQRVQRLSRNASSTSAQTLSEVRSYLYSIDVLNQTHFALSGQYFIDASQFATIYGLLEEYASQLIQGSDTGTIQSSIASELQTLQERIQQIN